MKKFGLSAIVGLSFGIALAATSAVAGPVYTFSVSTGKQPANAGIITLTQNGLGVDISVDLAPTGAGASYGFINSGGPHTPFVFNLDPGAAPTITTFTTPANGLYATGVFSLNNSGGDATPFGTFGIALDSSANNGSGTGYFGDLLFTLTRSGGLDTNDFITNGVNGYYFAADLSDSRGNTGSQAWATRTGGCRAGTQICGNQEIDVPEPATLFVFGSGLLGFMGMRRRAKKIARA